METIASWPHMATICRSFFDYTLGKRFQVMGHGIKVRSKFWDTPMLMLKPLPQYGWKLGTQQTQKSWAMILGMSQKYKPPVVNRGNGKSTIHRFVSHEKSPFTSGFYMIFPRHWRQKVGSHILTYFPASTWNIIQGTHEDCTSEISRIENTWWNLP